MKRIAMSIGLVAFLSGGCSGDLAQEDDLYRVKQDEGAPANTTSAGNEGKGSEQGGSVDPFVPPPPVASTCLINLHQCIKHPCVGMGSSPNGACDPHAPRQFADMRGKDDPHLCMQRAAEYSAWCGNPKGTWSIAKFYVDGMLMDRKAYRAGDGCLITIHGGCPAHPQMPAERQFHDFWGYAKRANGLQSDKNINHCQRRVNAYFKWCGITCGPDQAHSDPMPVPPPPGPEPVPPSPSIGVSATFFQNGHPVAPLASMCN